MANNGQEEAAASASTDRQLRVLVVEDDPDALSATVEMLQLLGHWATGVRSAEIAKDRYYENAFDVLMTDIGLPALSGLDLAEILRTRFDLSRLGVIFATGRPPPETPVPDAIWLQKPYSVEQLAAALSSSAGARMAH